jgi:hypothetical protein
MIPKKRGWRIETFGKDNSFAMYRRGRGKNRKSQYIGKIIR